MEEEKMDVFDRAFLFLYQAALEELGFTAELRVVKKSTEEE